MHDESFMLILEYTLPHIPQDLTDRTGSRFFHSLLKVCMFSRTKHTENMVSKTTETLRVAYIQFVLLLLLQVS
jgi:hypothetical protein